MAYVAAPGTTMTQMFSHIGEVEFEPLQRGICNSLGAFYDEVVRANELDQEIVLRWWDILRRYSEENDFIAFIRRYGNIKADRTMQRRGFLTKYQNGSGYVFCDNSVADYIYTMARARFVPEYGDFVNYIRTRRFPIAVRCVREEYEHDEDGRPLFQAVCHDPTSKPKGLYMNWRRQNGRLAQNKRWYLAHILDVDDWRDYPPAYRLRGAAVMSQGNRRDWFVHIGDDYPCRVLNADLLPQDRALLVAHFLRLTNPMNYFLTPQKGFNANPLQRFVVDGVEFRRGIQEYPLMKLMMRKIQQERFGDSFLQYENLALALPYQEDRTINELRDVQIDLSFCNPNERLNNTGNPFIRAEGAANRRRGANGSRRPHVTYDVMVNGTPYRTQLSMGDAAYYSVAAYCENTPNVVYPELRVAFPRAAHGSREVVEVENAGLDLRRFSGPIILNDRTRVVVTNQWCGAGPHENWQRFVDHVETLDREGLEIRIVPRQ